METFKPGDIVARKSYNFDIVFRVVGMNANGQIELVGLNVRIVADSPDYDLKHIEKDELTRTLTNIENSRRARISRSYMNMNKKIYNNKFSNNYIRDQMEFPQNPNLFKKETMLKKPGIILHVDRRFRIY